MPFQKGNKLGGRKPGSISEKTKLWAALGEMVINEGAKRAMDYLNSLQGEAYLKAYISLLEYFKPKLRRTDVTTGDQPISDPFEGMTFEQLYELKYGRKPDKQSGTKSET